MSEHALSAAAFAPPAELKTVERRAMIAGIAGLGLAAILSLADRDRFFQSYLVAMLLWVGIAAGSLALLMLQHLTGGAWGLLIRRPLEAAARTLLLSWVLLLPVIASPERSYVWARPAEVAKSEMLQHKAPYLNSGFFLGRALLYFVLWGALAFLLDRLSRRQDETGEKVLARRMRKISGPGIVLYALAATFASVDWLMSLDPTFASSIYGIYFVGSQALAALAFAILAAAWLRRRGPMDRALLPAHFHDYGTLMLAFIMLWAYFGISQFLIIWSGNIPEEARWYLARTRGGWQWVGLALVLFHFALPFFLLLSRPLKRDPRRLQVVALLVLVMRWVDLYWQAAPAWWPTFTVPPAAPLLLVGIGGLWIAAFAHELGKRPLVPVRAPGIEEALAHE